MTSDVGQELGTEVLTTIDQLQRIIGPWRRLWQRCRWASPFQCPEWLLPWSRCWAVGSVHALALWRDNTLVGLAPWRLDIDAAGRRRGVLLGAASSDYLDVLVDPRWERPAAAAVLAHLSDPQTEVDLWELTQLAPEGFLARSLHASRFAGLARASVPCPVLPLDSGGDCLADCLPTEQYKKLQYYRRRLTRSGAAEYERIDRENFDGLFSALVRLHTMRWKDRDRSGVLADSLIERFHRDAARQMLESGHLRQYALRLDGRAIAVYYGFHSHGRSYYYLSGFAPAYRQLSPGMLVVGHAIEQALADRATAFDFLRGQESYKYAWGARDRPTYRWRIGCNATSF